MAWRKSYGKTHTYDETVKCAEEKSFLEEYKHPMIQLDPFKTMLVMSHSLNTFNKDMFRKQDDNPILRKTDMKIKDFIKDRTIRDIFMRDFGSSVGGVVTAGSGPVLTQGPVQPVQFISPSPSTELRLNV
jgi:hypothetical protein